jgi:asparagine synthase (glutamine-hydrolysing)
MSNNTGIRDIPTRFAPIRLLDARAYLQQNIKDPRTEEEMILGVRERLIDAVKQRLRADVKVGVSLSGGIDSSVVAGIVNHLIREGHQIGSEDVNERLSCFGIAFDEDSGFDESATASRTADFLGVKFHKKHMNEAELARAFADATWHDEQPNPDLNFIGTYALSELFREQGFRVNINGQGADEILSGYNIFLPDFLRESDEAFNGPTIAEELRTAELHKAEEKLNKVYGGMLDLAGTSVARRQLNNTLTPAQMAAAFPPLPFKKDFLPSNNQVDPQLTYAESITGMMLDEVAHKWHPLHTAQYTFCKAHLQNLLLSNLGDRGEMAHSIEGRTPFLDHHLTEYVNNLPPSMKIRWDEKGEWVEKYVLREAAKPFITEEIYQKRKHPYSAPVEYPRDGPMYKLLKELVTDENVAKLGFLTPNGVEKLVDEVFETMQMPTFRLVICLAQWVVLQQRFGVSKAASESDRHGPSELKMGANVMLG